MLLLWEAKPIWLPDISQHIVQLRRHPELVLGASEDGEKAAVSAVAAILDVEAGYSQATEEHVSYEVRGFCTNSLKHKPASMPSSAW